ncbi:flagellar hook-basal body complex protein FliE [Alteromonas oceani]|jgi:flagellar hook-basal body complex protein FliE|uniref:Flagellar hook-basal body complex protein FliE n=1 Tax=Alteromonas oceani TaxID=2071609 RepID=A0ABV7JQL7_9ALTE|nr:flagellar hook-basal body complex protein FliE [Alteromonas oceani]MAD09708.1 flagellar hook-basal body complex protein FliE [Alteromonas sp.]MAQ02564.1 flagellar hook-basal body complex protein FliE [Alteromonadaceae bacterium]MDG6095959.1 flagellar hook-basal body complex protein FliE [Alteromonas sp. ZYF713]MCP4865980.1 flagellar hook-basal body complex protein FliE [Alteromonas sp.]HCB08543.1 flagellar hook-basal body complex protein FliE [Alteromonas sp.]|tara:strand:- start:987 stop:1325 length:339 start_codon:yes stop_codon:yes gene_type:complete
MDVKANSLYQEMQAMIAQTRLDVNPQQNLDINTELNTSKSDFAAMLGNAVEKVNSMQLESKEMTQRFEMGDKSLSLAEVMLAKEKSGIAFEATVQVRNKVLEAYKQIMNMPV